MTEIVKINLRSILDSRGYPTVEADIYTGNGGFGRACAPSGASTGIWEAKALPAEEAVIHAKKQIIPKLLGTDADDQREFDRLLREIDGTEDFSCIGSNISTALSLANAKAAADERDMDLFRYLGGEFTPKLPLPLGNVVGGGAHAVNATDIQEFLIIPTGAKSAWEAVLTNAKVHQTIRELLKKSGNGCGKGDEGAWAPKISDWKAFKTVQEAISLVSDETGIEIRMGIDVAASELWNEERKSYVYKDTERSVDDQISYLADLCDEFNLKFIEDPIQEEDFDGFADFTKELAGRDTIICGDDIFVTNIHRLQKGIECGAANAVLIKPNQIGTLTDTAQTISLAKSAGYNTVMSHRSGETTDETIAHLATAFGCCLLKTGVVGGERIAKLNELVRIDEIL